MCAHPLHPRKLPTSQACTLPLPKSRHKRAVSGLQAWQANKHTACQHIPALRAVLAHLDLTPSSLDASTSFPIPSALQLVKEGSSLALWPCNGTCIVEDTSEELCWRVMLTPHLFNAFPHSISAHKSVTVSWSMARCAVSAFGLQSRLLPHRITMLVYLDLDGCDSQRTPGPSSRESNWPQSVDPKQLGVSDHRNLRHRNID